MILTRLIVLPACAMTLLAAEPHRNTVSIAQATATSSDETRFATMRRQMVDQQLRARGIRNEAVLAAMLKIPRHRFVRSTDTQLAYADMPLPITSGQTISQPYIVAYMTEVLDVGPKEKVLEIGTGSGYQAAVLAEIAREVYSIEIVPELAEQARVLLQKLGYRNVQVRVGDGYLGWPEAQPFDAIIVTAAPDHVPQPLVQQLAANGRMTIPVGRTKQTLLVISKTSNGVVSRETLPVRFVPLVRKPQ